MQVDFTQELLGYNGKPIPLSEGGPNATLGDIAIEALAAPPRSDDPRLPATLAAVEHLRREGLMRRIYEAKEPIDLKAEDVALIKQLIPQRFAAPVVCAPALRALDPTEAA